MLAASGLYKKLFARPSSEGSCTVVMPVVHRISDNLQTQMDAVIQEKRGERASIPEDDADTLEEHRQDLEMFENINRINQVTRDGWPLMLIEKMSEDIVGVAIERNIRGIVHVDMQNSLHDFCKYVTQKYMKESENDAEIVRYHDNTAVSCKFTYHAKPFIDTAKGFVSMPSEEEMEAGLCKLVSTYMRDKYTCFSISYNIHRTRICDRRVFSELATFVNAQAKSEAASLE